MTSAPTSTSNTAQRTASLTVRTAPSTTAVARFGITRRLVSALMRSLAAPHF